MRLPSLARRAFSALLAVCILVLATGAAAFAVSPESSPQSAPFAVVNDGSGPQFYSGVNIDVQDDVSGDVYVSGQSVTISGNVTGDVIAAAQTISITGNVDGNVRLAGQDVTISGEVARSGTIFAATLTVTDAGSFGDDLVGAAGDIAISGAIGRDVEVGVGNLTINGTVGGNLTYNSDQEANIAADAVSGNVERIAPEPEQEPTAGEKFVGWLLGLLYALVALSLITVLAGWLFPRLLHRVTDRLLPRPWLALLVGFVASIAVPLVVVLLLATVIGAPLALAVLLVWITLTLATFVVGAYFIGRLIFRGNQHPVVKALVGGLILIVALHIPWLNIVVWLAMVFLGLGAQLLAIYDRRPWRRVPPVSGVAGATGASGASGVEQRRGDDGDKPPAVDSD
ncbi:hypothetical protein MUK71_15100 [Arthrobacter zhangbolii]|uniref:DUF8173 domain-containing protein n=1 Tax=Arthrobacter zhangbolii TaxID=2886936 RepID=A0A9X1S9G9_9MICC|nr:hypothetical protein [Arthrobacter zhangbolii]MCC3272247.1 hypothetical protein [Arthrobacter zhangbolii]UON91883.1 hypothetical protein MUK71_15100 [Arthrobacter zhangbolii]